MQVNSSNWAAYGLSAETAFDPARNICAGARILGEAFQIERRAACRYNAGRPDCGNRYPELVQRAEARLGKTAPEKPEATAAPPTAPPKLPEWDAFAAPKPPEWDAFALARRARILSRSNRQ